MTDELTEEQRERLERQREALCSDDHIRYEVELWRDTTPEQRLAELAEMCEASQFFLGRLDPEALERALRPDPLPADSEAVLVALRRER